MISRRRACLLSIRGSRCKHEQHALPGSGRSPVSLGNCSLETSTALRAENLRSYKKKRVAGFWRLCSSRRRSSRSNDQKRLTRCLGLVGAQFHWAIAALKHQRPFAQKICAPTCAFLTCGAWLGSSNKSWRPCRHKCVSSKMHDHTNQDKAAPRHARYAQPNPDYRSAAGR